MEDAEPPEAWGLPALDDDTLGAVIATICGLRAADIAAAAMTCTSMAAALRGELQARKEHQVEALLERLGWSTEIMAEAQILHSTGQGITDSELLLLCCVLFDNGPPRHLVAAGHTCVAPQLDHLNLGSNCIGDRGILGLVDAASRAPRELGALMLSSNNIGDDGACVLARAIEARVAFPHLRMLSFGGNASVGAAGETALRDACRAAGVAVRGVGQLRGAPLVRQPMAGSWVVRVAVDSADASRSSVMSPEAFARGVRERALARGDPLICEPPDTSSTA